ncbi:hypothetical protein GEMRC1_001260 [Eukaryota sp. GEM-RC1]
MTDFLLTDFPSSHNPPSGSDDKSCNRHRSSPLTISHSALKSNQSSSTHLYFQQSLLVLIHSHYLRRLLMSSLKRKHRHSLLSVIKELPSFFKNVGYVSRRFFESAFPALKVFFETNTFPMNCDDLPLIPSITSVFGAEIQSVVLEVDQSFEVEHISELTSIISHLKSEEFHFLHELLDNFSYHFLPHLRVLDVTVKRHHDSFTSFCKSLKMNTVVSVFHLQFNHLSFSEVVALVEVYSSNNTLKTISLSTNQRTGLSDEQYLVMFTALSRNLQSVVEAIDLSRLKSENSNVLLPLLNISSLRMLKLPPLCDFDCDYDHSVFQSLEILTYQNWFFKEFQTVGYSNH